MDLNKKILVIIPAYNEEENIGWVIRKLKTISDISFDILVINDKSTDNTSSICRALNVEVIDLPVNLGAAEAVQSGYIYAKKHKYDIVVQMDGDGQHNSEYILDLVNPIIDNKADLAIGSRFIKKMGFQSTFLRRLGIIFFSKLIHILTGEKITDPTSGFRAGNTKIINLFSRRYYKDFPEPKSIIALKKKGLKILEIPVIMNKRLKGKSFILPSKSFHYLVQITYGMIIEAVSNIDT